MLARAPKRSLPQDVYRSSLACLEGLQLPFLCPALYQKPSSTRTASSITQAHPKRRRKSPTRGPRRTVSDDLSHQRAFASAATSNYIPQHDVYVPWEGPISTDYSSPQTFDKQSVTALPTFDPTSSPIILKDSLQTHPRKFRVSKDAISGNINEIHQTLHACLQVGRLERAAALVRRLNEIYKPDAPGLLAAHKDYVGELSYRIIQNKDQQLLQHLQKWFEVDLVGAKIQPNDAIYAMMIRASLQKTDGSKDRTVGRYMKLAKEAGIFEETEELLSLYDDVDIGTARDRRLNEKQALPSTVESELVNRENTSIQATKVSDEVRQTKQKGLGLSTLKKALSMFSETASLPHSAAKDLSQTERQRLLEINTVDAALDRWREEDTQLKRMGVKSGLSTSSVGAMLWKLHEMLLPMIKEDIRKSQEAEQREKKLKSDEDLLIWGPCLQTLSPEKVSAITILVAMRVCAAEAREEKSVRIGNLVHNIGEAVQNESIAEAIRRNKKDKDWRRLTNLINTRSGNESLTKLVRHSTSREYDKLEWGGSLKVKLGAALLSHLMEIAKIPVSKEDPGTGLQVQDLQPVFFHTYKYVSGKRVGVVQLNSFVVEKLSKVPVITALAKYLPMVCEPKPWTGFAEGGFLEAPMPVIRLTAGASQAKQYAVTATENGDMAQVFAGLDVLAKTPWNINRFVFDTMLEVWNSGQPVAKIPPENPPIEEIPEPPPSDNLIERAKWLRRVRENENHRAGLKSQRCFQNFQLEVARAYLNDTFYFPHNCDFRGRAYPMTPFMNHMGADNVRGLLVFAQGKELTAKGLWWLKVHLANVFGYDKASFAERLEFTEAHLAEIRDSVNKPLNGEKWWLKAEDPWQCLAACKELKSALDLADPTKYVCKLPIHQDGTCNGLQHYAALGGDAAGAQQVNLEPGPRPSDIYTGVAELVKADIARDAARGEKMAKALDGKVTRKVVKQTVMTNVYGVTFTGAKRQVRKQLDDLYPGTLGIDPMLAAPYIARKIFAALANLFNGAHDIQHWLTDCAGRISESLAPEQVAHIEKVAQGVQASTPFKRMHLKGTSKTELTDFKSTVIWTTPLKMPVVQPYRKQTAQRIETNLQRVTLMSRSAADPVHKAKQLQAFPPNFIHSLDATHMFLTALKCQEVGLTFAAIHDSFWTHAGEIDVMNRIIRDAFVRIHSEDVIGRLAAEFKARYKDHMQLASIRFDTPVAKKILAWRRKRNQEVGRSTLKDLKARKWDELILERRRLRLLASEDPEKRQEGQQMDTPGKIFFETADEKSLAPTEVEPATIGLTPGSRNSKLKANQQLEVGDTENVEPIESTKDDQDAAVSESDVDTLENQDQSDMADNGLGEDTDGEAELSVGTEDAPKTKKTKASKKTWVWLPLTFPPVPKKGDFDVTRLRDSQYFFS